MVQFPEVQTKAQEELDRVCAGRLPTFDDVDALPYVEAIVREALRWNPVFPEGETPVLLHRMTLRSLVAIPHSLVEDDVYEGYYLPKGSIIVPNNWYVSFSSSSAMLSKYSQGNPPRRNTLPRPILLQPRPLHEGRRSESRRPRPELRSFWLRSAHLSRTPYGPRRCLDRGRLHPVRVRYPAGARLRRARHHTGWRVRPCVPPVSATLSFVLSDY